MRPPCLATSLLAFTATIFAQQPHSPAATGTVAGTVTCNDTQHPARFAQVMLFGIPHDVSAPVKPDAASDPAQLAAVMKSAMSANLVQTQTGIDGGYVAANVAPGDYYVFASVSGYLQAVNLVRAAQEAGADLSKPIAGLQTVHVAPDRTVRADITVSRGAAVSGKVLWDDGSPVTRAIVTVTPAKGKEKDLPPQFGMIALGNVMGALMGITDDVGHFRLSGLAPGDYLLQATLQTHTAFAMQSGKMNLKGLTADTPLVVFAPAAFHRADAKAVTLHTAEDRADAEITFNLAGLHSVSGTIVSAETHHPINSGTVKLIDAGDKDFSRSASVDANGTFTITFVPSGTYSMTIADGEDTEPAPPKEPSKTGIEAFAGFTSDHTLRSYEPARLPVIVTDSDLAAQNLELTPSKTTKKDVDLNSILAPSN